MLVVVVDVACRCWAYFREVVDANPSQDLVVDPIIVVRPIVKLLVDSCQQTNRAIHHKIVDDLRLCGLLPIVTIAFLGELLATSKIDFLVVTQRCGLDFCVKCKMSRSS